MKRKLTLTTTSGNKISISVNEEQYKVLSLTIFDQELQLYQDEVMSLIECLDEEQINMVSRKD